MFEESRVFEGFGFPQRFLPSPRHSTPNSCPPRPVSMTAFSASACPILDGNGSTSRGGWAIVLLNPVTLVQQGLRLGPAMRDLQQVLYRNSYSNFSSNK